MPTPPSTPESLPPRPLIDRVQERVDAAAAKLTTDEHRKRHQEVFLESQDNTRLEVQALRRVFRDMGRRQRDVRRQTGQAPSPVVRQAAVAFRQCPNLPALVLVAASLDEVGLLFW